jgi:transcriptional regulator with XRE-family HTH domain
MVQQKRRAGVQCDPEKLRSFREKSAITQEKLAILCAVNRRTVQRAERGEPISLETLADLAAALRVSPDEIRAQEHEPSVPAEASGNVVTLRPASTGRAILEVLERAQLARLDCEVEPTLENMPVLRAVILAVEAIMPGNPWDPESNRYGGTAEWSLVDKLDRQATITSHLQALRDARLSLFVGGSVELARMPQNGDEGLYTTAKQLFESVWTARLLIAPSGPDRLVVSANVQWPVEVSNLDDEIPF